MEYYYTPKENILGDTLLIKDEEAKHLSKVLRKKIGEEIYVTDGEMNLYKAKILETGKGIIECGVLETKHNVNETQNRVVLFQSLLRNPDRFEFAIEKAVELGAAEIIPVISENVVNKKTDRQPRWQSIALSAMKQSQRCYLPKVTRPVAFGEAIKNSSSYGLKLIAHERIGPDSQDIQKLMSGVKNPRSVCLFIGPEGGFTESEVDEAKGKNFKIIYLGNRKLRSETASVVILSLLFAAE